MKIIKEFKRDDFRNTVLFLNLTNGIEFYNEEVHSLWEMHPNYCRIASTDLEQHNFNRVISDLDYNFLFALATGQRVLIVDYSSKKDISRALFMGVPFVETVLNKEWFDKTESTVMVRNHNVASYFEEEYKKLTDESLRKIRYFKKLVTATELDINVWCGTSHYDNKYTEFKKILNKYDKFKEILERIN